MKKVVMTMVLAGSALIAADRTFTGVVTDSMCGKDHAMMNIKPDAKCAIECAKKGSKYAVYDGSKMYVLSDQATPAKFAGQKVKVTGTLVEKTGIIRVAGMESTK